MGKSKVFIKMKMKINIHAVLNPYEVDKHEKNYKIVFQKRLVNLCREHLATFKF